MHSLAGTWHKSMIQIRARPNSQPSAVLSDETSAAHIFTRTMHAGRRFKLREVLYWTRRDILWYLVLGSIPTLLYQVFDWKWLTIPWVPSP
jgi:hypothetical protein